MKYVVFLVGETGTPWTEKTEEEQAAEMGRHEAFGQAVEAREGCELLAGEALTGGDSATVLRPAPPSGTGDAVLTDGPFSEATEGIGGFYLVEAPDLDVLVDLIGLLTNYVMEIRPVVEF